MEIQAQYLRLITGTDIPMQYLIGMNYQQGKYISGEASIGYVGIPYNGDLYRVINVPESQEAVKDFLMETTDDGYVVGFGMNGHYKKWYGGMFFQRLELHASATYNYLLGTELFQEELNEDQKILLNAFLDQDIDLGGIADINLDENIRLTSTAWQAGIKVGRRFMFKNQRWEFRTELAWSKNLSSETVGDYDSEPFDQVKLYYSILKTLDPEYIKYLEDYYDINIPLDIDLDNLLDVEKRVDEVDDWFHKYAYIPTLNLKLSYLLFIPKKLRKPAEEEKLLLKE